MSGSPNGTPVFDRSRISHRESKQVTVLQVRVQAAQRDLDADMVERCLEEIDAFFAKILVSVPHDYLLDGAPENLDWSDPSSLNWIRADKYDDLLAASNPTAGGKKV